MVPRLWPESTIVCLGGGPSLTAEDVDYCRGRARVIAINNAYQLAPWADVLWYCDKRWMDWHPDALDFAGRIYSFDDYYSHRGVVPLQNTGVTGIEAQRNGLRNGRNSGYQAIGLAVLLGARRIVLLGYDMDTSRGHHWHGAHPNNQAPPVTHFLQVFPSLVEPLRERGIEVWNCTRHTQLQTFRRVPLTDALPKRRSIKTYGHTGPATAPSVTGSTSGATAARCSASSTPP